MLLYPNPTYGEIRTELFRLLYNSPNYEEKMDVVCEKLLKQFPELTESERLRRYEISDGKWEWRSKVELYRFHLVGSGWIADTNNKNICRLTEDGLKYIIENHKDFVEDRLLNEKIKSDFEEFETEISSLENFIPRLEGEKKFLLTAHYERDLENRTNAIKFHGTTCKACEFNFGKTYGELGKDYIEVHHLKPVSTFGKGIPVNPKVEMTVLCANCHRMMHRDRNRILTLEELKEIIKQNTGAI